MTRLMRGLMSWMKRETVSDGYRDQLRTWAQTEYKKDWQFAYQYMLENNGKSPSWWDIHGTKLTKEVS